MGKMNKYIKEKCMRSIAAVIIAAAFCMSACSDSPDSDSVREIAGSQENTGEGILQENSETDQEDNEGTSEDEQEEEVNELTDKHVRIRLDGDGWDVFALWGGGRPDYRYGPSIIINEDGSADAWFASPGDSRKEYDWITYRHSDDGGRTWGEEKVVLSPTPGTADRKSVCDPDVVYYKGYYYMAYTGTVNEEGLCNNVFIARSRKPDGPYEKWGVSGWGSAPVPVVYYYGVDIGWGVGEPSLVIVDDRLYIYSTLDAFSTTEWVRATRVHFADLEDPMWPSAVQFGGVCVNRHDHTDDDGYTYEDSDSWDVVYLEDSNKFLALTTNRRFKDDSCLLYYESYDGINFDRVSESNTGVICGCHNCGLSGDAEGHIGPADKALVGYAYSGSGRSAWGVWATRFVPVRIDYTDSIDRSDEKNENLKQKIDIDESLLSDEPIMLITDQLTYLTTVSDNPVSISYYTMNSYRRKSRINSADVRIEKYDKDMFRLSDDNRLIPTREGSTTVAVEYKGLRRNINIRILPREYDYMEIREFYPVCRRYDIKVNEMIVVKVRPMAIFGDYDLQEFTERDISLHEITFRSSNESVCIVDEEGIIYPVAPGASVITVQHENCRYTIEVHVSE